MDALSQIFTLVALFGWVPLVLTLFTLLPARGAVVASSIAAWLVLPPVGIDLPGLPNYDKAAAATVGILVGTLLFQPHRFTQFRLRRIDLPMLLWCVAPFFSSLVNGLGPYDGMSMVCRQSIAWFFPYLVGRLYLTDTDGLRELALGMVVGGVCLIPFCFLEMKMSPIMLKLVYGFGGLGGFEGTRYGIFRPRVFFGSGLELGLWMNAVSLVGWWLWRTGQLKTLWGIGGRLVCAVLLVTTVACRSTGATVLLFAGMSALWICHRTKTKWAIGALLLAAPLYGFVRINDLWSGANAVEMARIFTNEERAHSLEYRLVNEDLLIAKALQRPFFGWGGWGRNLVYDESGRQISVVDGMWMVALGNFGLVGLLALTTALLLPAVLFLRQFSVNQWAEPNLAPVAAIAVIVDLCLLDGLFNGMLNVIYIIAVGGLVNVVSARVVLPAELAGSAMTSAAQHAIEYRDLGRTLKDDRRYAEAKTAWCVSLDLLSKLASAQPDHSTLHQQWCDCANDLAWLLANAPDPTVRDPSSAVSLASQITAVHPECSTYWNTLGAAYYRGHQFEAAISAFTQATALAEGGTSFDHFFLAMAHAQLGDKRQAEQWMAVGVRWMELHRPGHPELIRLRDEVESIRFVETNPALAMR
jgi:tetratricopeptide (TPR) repeat protein